MQKSLSLLLIFLIFILSSCQSDNNSEQNDSKQKISKEQISPQLVALNNQGVGEMGYFDYGKAAETFKNLVQQRPEWGLAQQNLAIALLNRQKPEDESKSIEIANQLLAIDENNAVAHYIIAILNFNQGQCDIAIPHLNKVITLDPNDAYPYYFLGQCFLQNGEFESALGEYKKAIDIDPYLRSAYYGGFITAQRAEKPELAKQLLESYQKLDANPKAKLAEIKYTKMGSKATAQPYNNNATSPIETTIQTKPPYFGNITSTDISTENHFGIVDLNSTGQASIFVESNQSLYLINDFLKSTQNTKPTSIKTNSGNYKVAWGDINNDNHIDAYVTGNPDQMYFGSENGFIKQEMEDAKIGIQNSIAIRLTDADHDGDLDILLADENQDFEIWNNNLDGTFRPLSVELNWKEKPKANKIYITDIDSDRDADILLISNQKLSILNNDRMWAYHPTQYQFENEIIALGFSDSNGNGYPEVSILFENQIKIHEFEISSKNLKEIKQFKITSTNNFNLIDINGNGKGEYLLSQDQGLQILDHKGKILENLSVNQLKNLQTFATTNGPELLFTKQNNLFHVSASTNRNHFYSLLFSGKEDAANSMRSNFSGIGTSFTNHNGNFYSSGDAFYNSYGDFQNYQKINLASGGTTSNDYIEMEWSDGVYQTELKLEPNKLHKITETQRQLSSCPVIFAWNNGKYEFLSDVLGVGGIGFAIGRNQYGVPRPWENYLIHQDQVSVENNRIKFQFAEPMEESAYLDQFSIEAIDVDQNIKVILDERMVINKPVATGKPLFYKNLITPTIAVNQNLLDVTPEILEKDIIAAPIQNSDHRFLGLVDPQQITLEFSENLKGDYHLIMNGWVEYGYSQTMFAAWQADLTASAPTIEAYIDNQWQSLLIEVGYPAGMPREASVPITIPIETKKLRISTNMEIYFDQIALIQTLEMDYDKYDLPLASANLHQLGYPKRTDNKQRAPKFDYDQIQPFWDTRYMEGAYSQIGDVTPLVNATDNALAIIGSGEAIEFSFINNLPEPKAGKTRYYILKFKGWAKDMDMMTKDGDTLAPIPKQGAFSENAKKLNQQFNTRFNAGK